jgi:hypothetical protein
MGFWNNLLQKRGTPITDTASLQRFLEARANFVTQTSLYGYLRTRAGTRFPELFSSDTFVRAINIAKWQLWLACLADVAVYAGGLLASRTGAPRAAIDTLMRGIVDEMLRVTGVPGDAGPDFEAGAQALRARIAACPWSEVPDDETASSKVLRRWCATRRSSTNSSSSTSRSCATRCAFAGTKCVATCVATSTPRRCSHRLAPSRLLLPGSTDSSSRAS